MNKPELNEFTIIVCKDYKDTVKFQEIAKELNLYENIKTDDKYHDAYINIYDHTYNFIIKNKILYICNIRVYRDDEKYKLISAREIFDYYYKDKKISAEKIKYKYPAIGKTLKIILNSIFVILGIIWVLTGCGIGLLLCNEYYLSIPFLLFNLFLIVTPIYWKIDYLRQKKFILNWIEKMKFKYSFIDFTYEYSRFGDMWFLNCYPEVSMFKDDITFEDKQDFENEFKKKFSAKISVN